MNLFDFDDYKKFVVARIRAMPRNGHGQLKKISEALHVHTSMLSQVFRGEKQLSLEQACALARFFGLTELETDYFLLLVQKERAGSAFLQKTIGRQLEQMKEHSQQLKYRLPSEKKLTEKDKALFYSSWSYSGIRLLTSVPGCGDVDAIAERLGLPKNVVNAVIQFLLSAGLCEEENGKIRMGPSRTHIEADSPLSTRHHTNWRLKAIENLESLAPEELAFTGPMSISKRDFPAIRKEAVLFIEKVSAIVKKSSSEELACLNLDWFML